MVFQNNLLMGAGGQAAGYEIDQSCRFNDDDSSKLSATLGTATSQQDWTMSFWMKRCALSAQMSLFGCGGNDEGWIFFGSDNKLAMQNSGGANLFKTTQVFRDVSAWYHICISNETANPMRLYVNGVEVTAFDTDIRAGFTWSTLNSAVTHYIATRYNSSSFGDLYFSQWVFVDGLTLTPTSFGETNSTTGQWVPIDVSGLTFGNNGFYLDFADSSDLGNDVSGNGNDFASSGLAAADQMSDSPTDNFCTMSSINSYSGLTLSDGNLTEAAGAQVYNKVNGTFFVPYQQGGQWYFEWTCGGDNDQQVGWTATDFSNKYPGQSGDVSYAWARNGGAKYSPGDTGSSSGQTYTSGDVLGWLLDFDAGEVKVGKVSSGSISYNITWTDLGTYEASGLGAWTATDRPYNGSGTFNFGANGFAVSSVPGKALSTANLSAPTIADPSAYFQPTIYTGDGASSLAVNQGGNSTFDPDFVWIKNRDATDGHCLFDSVRGATELLASDSTAAEVTDADTLLSFDSDGFSVGADVKVNTSSEKYVGWQWLESATPGFDIVGYTGNATNRTISHSLGAVPELIIVKIRDAVDNWTVYHASNTAAPATDALTLDSTAATQDAATFWNDTAPTSSVFSVGTGGRTNTNTKLFVAYLWAGVEGFSKFGSYTGNGSADGPFVWCGFTPAFVMTKRTNDTSDWKMWDNQRGPYNVITTSLAANSNAAGNTGAAQYNDLLSNGFKIRGTDTETNGSDSTYIFAAFAETPFKTANAR